MSGLIRVAGAAIVDSLQNPSRLLAAKRTAPPEFAGMWEFPGGKVEDEETFEQALHRELREELGVAIHVGNELVAPSEAGWPLNERAVMRVWFAQVAAGEPRALEDHDELRWIPLADGDTALRLPWIPADEPIVRALLEAVASPV